jgi:glycosyltransferase involved in cell wall biosynthesis
VRVAIVNRHPTESLGGSEIQCDIIAAGLQARGHEVTYVAIYGRRAEYAAPYPVVPVPSPGFFSLFRVFRRHRHDIVYWRNGKQGLFVAALAARLAGARFVYSISHVADALPWRSTYGGAQAFRLRGLSPRHIVRWMSALLSPLHQAANYLAIPLFADLVVSNNADFLEGVHARRKAVVHNSMSTRAVPFAWPRPFVAWVANIKSRKRPEDFFRVSQELRDTGLDFIMVGALQDPAYAGRLAEWGRQDNFHYLGAMTLEEVNGFLAAGLLLVNTCEPEGFPNNCIQAWLQGRPVVSLRFDPEGMLEREGLGRYSRDFTHFSGDVRSVALDEKLRLECGLRARDYATGEFGEAKNIPRLESLMRGLRSKNLQRETD